MRATLGGSMTHDQSTIPAHLGDQLLARITRTRAIGSLSVNDVAE